jgi:lycopene cyclase-like protein
VHASDKYVWLIWSSAFLLPWLGLFLYFPRDRKVMTWASLLTMPFGLTEPLFVPRYWNPPSLFDLAQRTGFDVESLIFCFAIGGVGTVLYKVITGQDLRPIGADERRRRRHHHHRAALLAPIVAFPILCLLPWNPIYPAIAAMSVGGAATVACRPDLKFNTLIGGGVFAAYYAVFMLLLEWSAPGYIDRVWNLSALSGVMVAGIPLEEIMFGFAFGTYWSGIFEHLTWQGLAQAVRAGAPRSIRSTSMTS